MTIREKGYDNWEGETSTSPFRWLPIFLTGIRSVFRKKFSKLLFSITVSPFLIFLIAIYVTTKPELKILAGLMPATSGQATLKRFYRENGKIRLQPSNPAISPIIVDHCKIQGVFKGLVRRV